MAKKSSKNGKNGKAGLSKPQTFSPPQPGDIRNPTGINGYGRFGVCVFEDLDTLVPVQLPTGEATTISKGNLIGRQLVKGAMDYNCTTCSEKQHLHYVTELLKRVWPVPKDAAPVVPIQVIVQQGPQETFVKAILAESPDGQAGPDKILGALVDLPGGNGKE